ncbi:hypothetical protein C0J52_06430 [Blattella germanica]|nr:hypothetical protein C0J52_06430 [Blattella germanica]PSN41956.1 hypothetical protein C0J52_06430 [Blattella germanica]
MLSSALCWFLGAFLLLTGTTTSTYLVWLQVQRGVTGFSILATSDGLATIAISIAFLLNAAHSQDPTTRISMAPSQCNKGQLTLASALFLAPFVNAFMSTMAHSVESKAHETQARSLRERKNPKLASGIAAQWMVPIISALVLLSAGVQHSRPFRSNNAETCMQGTAIMPISVETTEHCLFQEDLSDYIAALMNSHNVTQQNIKFHKPNDSKLIEVETSNVIDKIHRILQSSLPIHRSRRTSFKKQQPDYEDGTYYNTQDEYYDKVEDSIDTELQDTTESEEPPETLLENESNINVEQPTEPARSTDLPSTQHEFNTQITDDTSEYITRPIQEESEIPTTVNSAQSSSDTVQEFGATQENLIIPTFETVTPQATIRPTPTQESSIHQQTESNLINVQIPDTVNLCLVKCYFSETFLKKYLFVLLFLGYFIPIIATLVLHFSAPSSGNIIEVKPSTAAESGLEVACTMQPTAVKHSLLASVILWTPTLVETLLRAWFCVISPEWLTTLLFVLAQAHAIIRNFLNVRLARTRACNGTVEPLVSGQDMPSKLFTKVKAAFLK